MKSCQNLTLRAPDISQYPSCVLPWVQATTVSYRHCDNNFYLPSQLAFLLQIINHPSIQGHLLNKKKKPPWKHPHPSPCHLQQAGELALET